MKCKIKGILPNSTRDDSPKTLAIVLDRSTHGDDVTADEVVEREIRFDGRHVDFRNDMVHGVRDTRLVAFSRACLKQNDQRVG